ncbi:MAG: hypothetical protein AVDCRST_MAG32-86, partial [uncultured Nocardioides sp.]
GQARAPALLRRDRGRPPRRVLGGVRPRSRSWAPDAVRVRVRRLDARCRRVRRAVRPARERAHRAGPRAGPEHARRGLGLSRRGWPGRGRPPLRPRPGVGAGDTHADRHGDDHLPRGTRRRDVRPRPGGPPGDREPHPRRAAGGVHPSRQGPGGPGSGDRGRPARADRVLRRQGAPRPGADDAGRLLHPRLHRD